MHIETEADGWAPLKNGVANFFAFLLFGLVPLIVYFVALIVDRARGVKLTGDAYNTEVNIVFGVCAGVTLITLAVLGCLKARITRENMLLSVFLTVLVGALACGVGFGVATLLEKVFVVFIFIYFSGFQFEIGRVKNNNFDKSFFARQNKMSETQKGPFVALYLIIFAAVLIAQNIHGQNIKFGMVIECN